MKVCSTENMQIAERELIVSGTPARTLMKLASAGIAESLMQFFPDPGLCVAYVGKGNNGGDALTVLNILKQHGWEIGFRTAYPRNEWSELSVRQLAEISPPPQEYQAPPLPHTGNPAGRPAGNRGKGNAPEGNLRSLRGNELYKKPLRGCTYRGY